MRYVRSIIAEMTKKANVPKLMLTINSRFVLKQDVQPDVLLQALRDCQKLYPVFGCTFEQEGDKIYLADNDAPFCLYETDKIIIPDEKRLNGYLLFVGYSGRAISVSVDHRLSDGSGVQSFFGKVLQRYEDLLNGCAEEVTGPAYDVSLMFQQAPVIPERDYREYLPYSCAGKPVRFPEVTAEKPYRCLTCRVDETAFMDYVRKHETTALAAISQITDKGIFRLYPDGGDFARMAFIISTKKALGMERSFANLIDQGVLELSRSEADDPECLKRMAADIKGQIADENIFYQATHMMEDKVRMTAMKSTYVCSYLRLVGKQDSIVEKHQAIPLTFDPAPKLDVRAYSGSVDFVVSGTPYCAPLYEAVKLGLAAVGIPILGEVRQTIEIENNTISLREETDQADTSAF